MPTPSPSCTQPIVLDGDLSEWDCQPFVTDPADDCQNEQIDLITFAFGNNPDDPTAYFMAERNTSANQPLGLRLLIDTNNNGDYIEATDRLIAIRYQPTRSASRVDVELYDGNGTFLAQIASNADWGESRNEGARRVEWGVSFAQLGVLAGQAIRMRLEALPGNNNGTAVCDTIDEIQWSPADALSIVLLAVLIGVGAFWFAQRRRELP
jgi:hypothetical protein